MDRFNDTIVALSTPPGLSGIGIVRLTGPRALALAAELFRPADPRRRVCDQPTYTLLYGHVVRGEEVVDEALLTIMRAPRTYTTQDVVEINCHGGPVPLRRTLELCLEAGARLADPGEFTRRAFYFGRMDLAQAEAVADLITAQTETAARAALAQLSGRLSSRIRGFRDEIIALLAQLEAQIDFGEDDLETLPLPQIAARLTGLVGRVQELLDTAAEGRLLRQGVRVALVGRPNVGKSSLMNALLGEERMIVTEFPGTTRDTVEECLSLHGVPVVLVDTAGLRQVTERVEQAGVARARAAMEQADVRALVLDRSVPLQEEDRALLRDSPPEQTVLVLNKRDLPPAWTREDLSSWPGPSAETCALTGEGLEELREALARQAGLLGQHTSGEVIITSLRHQQALECSLRALTAALTRAQSGATEEYLAEDLRAALAALGEIVGTTSREEIIEQVFARFCIGK